LAYFSPPELQQAVTKVADVASLGLRRAVV
jgi:hypothetical protein